MEEYNYITKANGWNDETKFVRLVSCFDGSARIWFFNERRSHPNMNWDSFVPKFPDKYTNNCDKILLQSKIMKRRQKKGESFDSYWDTKIYLIDSTVEYMKVKDKMNHLFNGLRTEIRDYVIEDYLESEPESVEQLYELIKIKTDAIEFIGIKSNEKEFGAENGETEQESEETEEENEEDESDYSSQADEHIDESNQQIVDLIDAVDQYLKLSNIGNRREKNLANIRCYNCGNFGHFARVCE